MHDVSLATHLQEQINTAMAAHGWDRVTQVSLKVGRLRSLSHAAIRLCIEQIFRETASAGAEVQIESVPAQTVCRSCLVPVEIDPDLPLCPGCGGSDLEVLSGDEFLLESLEGH